MSYKTMEVELENGWVHPSGAEVLPQKARALLTILDVKGSAETGKGRLADRVAHLAGIGRGNFTDLSTEKSHTDNFPL